MENVHDFFAKHTVIACDARYLSLYMLYPHAYLTPNSLLKSIRDQAIDQKMSFRKNSHSITNCLMTLRHPVSHHLLLSLNQRLQRAIQ